MLYLYRSNSLKKLADVLAENLRRPPALPPTIPEIIVIGSKGMDRWLSYQLTTTLGVWANPSFPFPEKFAQSIFAPLSNMAPISQHLFLPDVLPWAIAQRLLGLTQEQPKDFAPIVAYLTDDMGNEKLLELADELACIFARYMARRHDCVDRSDFWQFEHGAWQQHLWQALFSASAPALGTPLHIGLRLISQALAQGQVPSTWPSRVHVFGFSTTPRAFLQLYQLLAKQLDVFFYAFSPTPLFLGDQARQRSGNVAGQHRLISNLGRQVIEFQTLLENEWTEKKEYDCFVEPVKPNNLLSQIQYDTYHLLDPADPDYQKLGGRFAGWQTTDLSLSVHACHGPQREIEVLRDELLRSFAILPKLRPEEIVVMLPNVEAYAPLIHAVFGGDDQPRLPYNIADRKSTTERPLVAAYLALLNLLQSRLSVDKVLDWLERPVVLAKFGLQQIERSALRYLIINAGIRWGLNDQHVMRLGLPKHVFTWQHGLDRLLLGSANAAAPLDGMFANLAAVPSRNDAQQALKALVDIINALSGALETAAAQHTPAAWAEQLAAWLELFFELQRADDDDDSEVLIREAIAALAQTAQAGGFQDLISLATATRWLTKYLDTASPSWRFLSGGITFCALAPLRNIPFRIIALVGMDADSFPRRDCLRSFDALSQARQVGDPSAQDDDRATFLAALLAAGERLIITFSGLDPHNNKDLPPSSPLAELLDLAKSYGAEPKNFIQRERLHGFDPCYFASDPEQARSFNTLAAAGATALINGPQLQAPFWREDLLLPVPTGDLELEQVIRAFGNPVKALLNQRLGLYLDNRTSELPVRETFELDPLKAHQLGELTLTRMLNESANADVAANAAAAAMLPPGQLGQVAFKLINQKSKNLAQVAHQAGWQNTIALACELHLILQEQKITLRGRRYASDRALYLEYGKLNARRQLAGWLRHLFANSIAPQTTMLLGQSISAQNKLVQITWPALTSQQAQQLLSNLLELYLLALSRPLAFEPDTAWAFVEAFQKGKDGENPASNVFANNFAGPSPASDPYVQKIWGQQQTFAAFSRWKDGEWRKLAQQVFIPLQQHQQIDDVDHE